jgi:signal transduction histidine kinase/CheY-like chemotaxis protein
MNDRAAVPGAEGSGGPRRDPPAGGKAEGDFRALAENLPGVVARLDRGLALLYLNRAAREDFGPAPWPWWPPLRDAAARAFDTRRPQSWEFEAPVGSQRHRYVGRLVPELQGATFETVVAMAVEAETRQETGHHAALLAQERNARATAESATLARDHFLAIVSHELRSPLNGIKSWTHVLENQLPDGDATVRRALAGIMIGVEHQVRLIEDLLDVTRAMSGTLGLLKTPVALQPILAEVVEGLRGVALERGVQVETAYMLDDLQIHGDADRLRQVFANLLSNALKFTPAGGTVWVSAERGGHMARVEFRDDGAGISPEFLPYIFDPFRQAGGPASRRGQEGLGLGLALVQRLAELHGGYVSCESDGVGRGATFRVYLPLRRDSGPRVDRAEPARALPRDAMSRLTGVRVLRIDDQREARESLAALLAQSGATVATAASSDEAMAHLALSDDTGPEVIVCDIAMPGEDGYATLKRIRAWEAAPPRSRRRERPAVAITAFAQREDRARALAGGFAAHLAKPVVLAELIATLAAMAGR